MNARAYTHVCTHGIFNNYTTLHLHPAQTYIRNLRLTSKTRLPTPRESMTSDTPHAAAASVSGGTNLDARPASVSSVLSPSLLGTSQETVVSDTEGITCVFGPNGGDERAASPRARTSTGASSTAHAPADANAVALHSKRDPAIMKAVNYLSNNLIFTTTSAMRKGLDCVCVFDPVCGHLLSAS